MIAYYGKKLLLLLGSLFLLSLLVFFIARLAPGDPLVSYYGDRVEKMSTEERWQAEERLGLNDPLPVQYARWLEGALQGDFGISYKYKTEVTEVIGSRAVNTLVLGGTAFALVFAGSLALGVFCVWHEGRLADRLICRIGTALSCIPEFWLSLLLILIFSVALGWLPSSGAYTPGDGGLWDRLQHLVLPLLVVVLGHLWYYSYMIRNRLMEEVRAEYVLLQKSCGLSKSAILLRHCLRNALPSYLSIMALAVPHIMGGTYVVEAVFSYPGLGTLSYESARYQDYNLLMLLCLISGAVVIFCSLLAQTVGERLDRRLKHGAEAAAVAAVAAVAAEEGACAHE